MLRLFLRLYVILALGLAGAIWLVNYTFDELLPEANEVYNREALRGPAYGLVEQLRPVQGAARDARLAELQPHYGLRLKLVPRDTLALNDREQQLLAGGQLVVRGDFMEFLTTIDGGPQLLQIKLPEEPKWLYLWAYGFLGVSLAIVLYFWVRPHWRDLSISAWPRSVLAITTSARASCCRAVPPCVSWPGTSTRWPSVSKA